MFVKYKRLPNPGERFFGDNRMPGYELINNASVTDEVMRNHVICFVIAQNLALDIISVKNQFNQQYSYLKESNWKKYFDEIYKKPELSEEVKIALFSINVDFLKSASIECVVVDSNTVSKFEKSNHIDLEKTKLCKVQNGKSEYYVGKVCYKNFEIKSHQGAFDVTSGELIMGMTLYDSSISSGLVSLSGEEDELPNSENGGKLENRIYIIENYFQSNSEECLP